MRVIFNMLLTVTAKTFTPRAIAELKLCVRLICASAYGAFMAVRFFGTLSRGIYGVVKSGGVFRCRMAAFVGSGRPHMRI